MNTSDVVKGVLAIVIASFLWGTTGTAAQFAPEISPLAIGAFAMGIGGVLLCVSARKSLVKDAPILFSTHLSVWQCMCCNLSAGLLQLNAFVRRCHRHCGFYRQCTTIRCAFRVLSK